MNITFKVLYSSVPGETVYLRFRDRKNISGPINCSLNYVDDKTWSLELPEEDVPYQPILVYDGYVGSQRGETIIFQDRTVDLRKFKRTNIIITDEPQLTQLYPQLSSTDAFRFIDAEGRHTKKNADKNAQLYLQIQLPLMPRHLIPAISGSTKKMHRWSEKKPLLMYQKSNSWATRINIRKEDFPLEFKVVIYDDKLEKIIAWEQGPNRIIQELPSEDDLYVMHLSSALPVHLWKGCGVNIPLTAIRTSSTWGVGDFSSLVSFGEWCRKAGLKLIQLLPVYDTTVEKSHTDSYPYAPLSAFALHPVFADVRKLIQQFNITPGDETEERIRRLNDAEEFDIVEATALKIEILRLVYQDRIHSYRDDFAWFEFFDLNREWLQPYAAFCFLRDKYGTADFSKWEQYAVFESAPIDDLLDSGSEEYYEIGFYYFIQFQLHLQFADAKDELHKLGILLKGDLPVGVNRFSVDAWQYPQYFNMHLQAGAPPDAFSETGQNWGFPTFNWKEMETDGYSWWRRRLEHLQQYFDAVRIDHIIGLFRIWSIPDGLADGRAGFFDPVSGYSKDEIENRLQLPADLLLGNAGDPLNCILLMHNNSCHFRINMQQTPLFQMLNAEQQQPVSAMYNEYFSQRQNDLWSAEGKKKLQTFQSFTSMLLCAEDLGMVPSMVEDVLHGSEILCLRVERMPVNNDQFFLPKNASYLSVVTPSTHDMSTIREWWTESEAPIQWYYNAVLQRDGMAPSEASTEICSEIIMRNLKSPAMLSVFLLQDLLSIDGDLRRDNAAEERINIPADSRHNWNYRMHITVDELISSKSFNHLLKNMLRATERC